MQISYDVFSGCPKNITVAAPAFSDAYYFAKSHGYPFRDYTNIRLQDDKEEAVTAKCGETVRFTVHPVNESKDGDSLTYQWMYYDGDLWRDLTWTGAKTPTLSVPVEASRESWLYECCVYNGSGSCTVSRPKRIIVKAAVTQQPKSVKQVIGTTATFSLKASGKNLSYQWQYNDGSGWKNCTWTGSRTAVLSVPAAAGRNGYKFRCIVKSVSAAKTVSGTATLTVK